jgi:hypothetical protein
MCSGHPSAGALKATRKSRRRLAIETESGGENRQQLSLDRNSDRSVSGRAPLVAVMKATKLRMATTAPNSRGLHGSRFRRILG